MSRRGRWPIRSQQRSAGRLEIEVLTGAEITEGGRRATSRRGLNFLTLFLSVFAFIALFVGSFVIYNVFSISAAQRQTRERACCVPSAPAVAQVTSVAASSRRSSSVSVGSLLGLLGGVGVSAVAQVVPRRVSASASRAPALVLDSSHVHHHHRRRHDRHLGSARSLPAIRSGRVPPLAAMRDVAIEPLRQVAQAQGHRVGDRHARRRRHRRRAPAGAPSCCSASACWLSVIAVIALGPCARPGSAKVIGAPARPGSAA